VAAAGAAPHRLAQCLDDEPGRYVLVRVRVRIRLRLRLRVRVRVRAQG